MKPKIVYRKSILVIIESNRSKYHPFRYKVYPYAFGKVFKDVLFETDDLLVAMAWVNN